MLQAMGLGGWMLNGMDPFSVLGASGNPAVPGMGFRFDTNERWPYPNPTGLAGIMEGYCPPHFSDMREAVETLCERKFGPGGPFHPETPGPWKDSGKIRFRRAGPQRGVQGMCGASSAVYFRSLRQIPRHGSFNDRDDLSAGPSPRSGFLRRVLRTRCLSANPR